MDSVVATEPSSTKGPASSGEELLATVESVQAVGVAPNVLHEIQALLASTNDPHEVCRASCALGLLLRNDGRFPESEAAFDRAVAVVPGYSVAARAGIYLAGLHARSGRFGDARDLLEAAAQGLAPGDRPLFELQSGFLAELSERLSDALEHYTAARLGAEELGNVHVWMLASNNRANVLNVLGEFAASEVALRQLLVVAEQGTRSSVLAQHNLGEVLSRRGAIRESLERTDRAALPINALSMEANRAAIGQTRALMEARLLSDAIVRSSGAISQARVNGDVLEVPELLVLQTRTHLGLRDVEKACTCLMEAFDLFSAQDRLTSAGQCSQVLGLLERHEIPEIGPDEPGADAVYEALIALGDHDPQIARACWTAAIRAVGSERKQLQVLGYYAQARLLLDSGDAAGAKGQAMILIEKLAEHTADINAVELRAALVFGLVDLEGLAVRIACAGDPVDLACIIDQANTVVHSIAPLSEADTELVAQLDALRMSLKDSDPTRIDRSEVELLEGRLRSLHRRMERTDAPAQQSIGIEQLRQTGCDQTLVMFAEVDDHLWRLVLPASVDLGASATLVDLGSRATLTSGIRRVRYVSDGLARRPSPIPHQLIAGLDRRAGELDEILFAGVDIEAGTHVMLFPGRFLTSVPWRVLPSVKQWCVGINAGTPLVCSPEASKTEQPPIAKRALVVAGPDLGRGIADEVEAVAAMYDDPIVLTGDAATVSAVLHAFEEVDIAHVAGHGSLHAKDPLMAMISLADGPLTVYDIEMANATPPVVVLASCLVGSGGSTGSDVSYGFASALASRGTRQLIISPVELDDEKTALVMPELHRSLVAGASARQALDSLRFDQLDLERVADSLLAVEAESLYS